MNCRNYTPDMHLAFTYVNKTINLKDFLVLSIGEHNIFSSASGLGISHRDLPELSRRTRSWKAREQAREPRALLIRGRLADGLGGRGRAGGRASGPPSLPPLPPTPKTRCLRGLQNPEDFSSSGKQFPRRRQMIQTPLKAWKPLGGGREERERCTGSQSIQQVVRKFKPASILR